MVKVSPTIDCFLPKLMTSGVPEPGGGDDFPPDHSLTFSFLISPGIWERAFQSNLTQKEDFFVNENTKVQVDMMRKTERMVYSRSEELLATMVKMPYKGNVSIILVLPDVGQFHFALKEITAKRARLQKASDFRYPVLEEHSIALHFCSALNSSM